MKKTVIKRRKRVPAAGGGSGEPGVNGELFFFLFVYSPVALWAVVFLGPSELRVGSTATFWGAVEAFSPVTRSRAPNKPDLPFAMTDQAAAEALVAVGRSRVSAASSPHSNNNHHPHPTDEDAEDAPRRKRQRRKAPTAAAAAAEEEQRERERERLVREDHEREREQRERKRGWFPGHGGGPFDLPPLERAFPPFGAPAAAGGGGGGGGYMRSASAGSGSVPSRGGAGSPAGGASASNAYTLAPVRQGYYGGGHDGSGANGVNGSAPLAPPLTAEDLERHYFNLHEQRRRTEELLRETERLLMNVKRGLDEMRGLQAEGGNGNVNAAGGSGPSVNGAGAPEKVPLRERERARSREGVNVWPVNGDAAGRE
ncbi:hypothetical protein C8F04DRAFT_1233112 [Mycena alexandri]|uniref:Uncharacterized protein n=1 Tax=Mycena alexandri TaxID=1745969 RepID=A0AAD6SZF9_9AGAR|nr:hypothetical protein C8F04DRAFT_1233112 [Mycena alexandri]